ncbi:MAG TPA: hypothetical protein VFV50_10450 [Bdellovibrionales bacterium]|nr:hypothetical protein [Bdellovibrionales bacterium]
MKRLMTALAILALGLSAHAAPKKKSKKFAANTAVQQAPGAASDGESLLKLNDAEPAEARTTKFNASVTSSYGTIVDDNNYVTGQRLNVAMLKPSLGITTANTTAYRLSVPMSWVTDQAKREFRMIGRPELAAMYPLANSTTSKMHLGPAVRLPLFDSSTGGAEVNRIWRVGAAFTADQAVGDGRYAVVGGIAAAYDSKYTAPEQSSGTYRYEITYERAPFVQGSLGLAKNYDAGQRLGASLNARYGIGKSKMKITPVGESSAYNEEWTWDMNPPEMTWIELFGNTAISANTFLTGSIQKSLKIETTTQNMFTAYDETISMSSLGISLGLSQTF